MEKPDKCSLEVADDGGMGDEETLTGKQEQHGEWATISHVALDMSFSLLGPLFLHLPNKEALKTFPLQ